MATITRAERVQAFLFLLVGVVVTVSVVITLVGLPFGREKRTYHLRFVDSVVGLDQGTPVRYKGVRYGEIRDIAVDPENPEQVVVTLAMDPEAPIKVSTTARISSASILGPYYVELFDSRRESPPLPEGSEIPAEPSTLSRLLKTGETVGDELTTLLANLESWTTPERRESFWATVEQLRSTLASIQSAVERVAPEAEAALEEYRGLAATLNGVIGENRETGTRLLRDLAASADRLRGFLQAGELEEFTGAAKTTLHRLTAEVETGGRSLREWLDENRLTPFLERATASLERLEKGITSLGSAVETEAVSVARADLGPALRELRAAAEALSSVLGAIERNPRGLLFGEPPAEKPLPLRTGGERR